MTNTYYVDKLSRILYRIAFQSLDRSAILALLGVVDKVAFAGDLRS